MSEPQEGTGGAESQSLDAAAAPRDENSDALTYVAATDSPATAAAHKAAFSRELAGEAASQSQIESRQAAAPAAAARDEVHFAAPVPGQSIDEMLLEPQLRRRVWLPLLLFLATCATTFLAGVFQWPRDLFPIHAQVSGYVQLNWQNGLAYMLAVIGILLAHEMGHFLMAVRYRIHASYPMFIPFPIFIGTMGAVIAMDGRQADRRQLFDIGIAGPLAGLVVAIPVLCIGVLNATLVVPGPNVHITGDPLLAELLLRWLRPDAAPNAEIFLPGNPFYMAGWVGMLVTGLNMMPISQLDGGHVIYSLFRRRAHYLARTFLLTAMAYMIASENYTWSLMVVIVTFLGVDHPPTADDRVPLGKFRYLLGLASLAIPVLCFIPNPF
jgi:Zn-dependent protease